MKKKERSKLQIINQTYLYSLVDKYCLIFSRDPIAICSALSSSLKEYPLN